MGNNREMRSTLVCVTDQVDCESLITAGSTIADKTNTDLHVVNVIDSKIHSFGELDTDALEYLYNVSKENKATMNLIFSENFVKVIKNHVYQYNAVNIVTGVPQNESSVLHELWRKVDNIVYYVVTPLGDVIKRKQKSSLIPVV